MVDRLFGVAGFSRRNFDRRLLHHPQNAPRPADLYKRAGIYWFRNGFHWPAIIALIVGILPCLPGFLGTVMPSLQVAPIWLQLYHYAWFISFAVSMAVYVAICKWTRPPIIATV